MVKKTKNSLNKISVALSPELRAQMEQCMKIEGYRVVSEFVSVAIHRRCRDIQRAAAADAIPVSEK
jgi:metal-responsive CopG/Arc/MetJ family transcriptional regulator